MEKKWFNPFLLSSDVLGGRLDVYKGHCAIGEKKDPTFLKIPMYKFTSELGIEGHNFTIVWVTKDARRHLVKCSKLPVHSSLYLNVSSAPLSFPF